MGKPFGKELQRIPATLGWANRLEIKKLKEIIAKYHDPVYIVGSGGSFSACVFAADLLTSKGVFAKAVTPLDLFYSKNTLRKCNIIFISASGNNTDILFAFKKAVECEPVSIVNICMRKRTKLNELASHYSSCTTFEFLLPSGKDGFLATNSLVAYFTIIYRAILDLEVSDSVLQISISDCEKFLTKIDQNATIVVLYGSVNHGVAVDIESKFSEAGLAPTLLSDYRHFAHGRHQWFNKNKNSVIIALNSPSDQKLASKTLALLPSNISRFIIATNQEDFQGTLHLLIQSMHLVNYFGAKRKIDPGRPGVPEYGSKIYHLKYEKLVEAKTLSIREVSILRKAKVNSIKDLSDQEFSKWDNHFQQFIAKIEKAQFGSIVFDYDGTLCSTGNRFNGMSRQIGTLLIELVKKGFVLAVISGRGKSLRADLIKIFERHPKLMRRIVVGYYNGSDIANLTDEKHPVKSAKLHKSLAAVKIRLEKIGIIADVSPNQLTFGSKTTDEWAVLKDQLLNELMLMNFSDLTIVESSHSIDIIPRGIASKNNILKHCQKLCNSLGISTTSLCIGDKGQWPGNDYALLANQYSLSVGEVSSSYETCWNICPPGFRDEKGIEYILGKLMITKKYFTLSGL